MEATATQFCQDIAPIIKLIRDGIIPVFQFGIPIILILYGILDFGKAVIASKEDEIKTAQKMFIKRLIYAIVTFLIVTIVTAIFNVLVTTGANESGDDWRSCWDVE